VKATAPDASDSPARRKADLQLCLLNSTREGMAAMPIVTMSLPVNVFIIALVTQAFPLSKPMIGMVCSLPFAANFAQIFTAHRLTMWRPPKVVSITAATGHLICWIIFGLFLPWLPRDQTNVAAPWIIGWFFVTSCFGAVAGVTWNAWVQEWVPARLRGKYFGRRNALTQFSATAFLLLVGWALARWRYAIPAFQAIVFGSIGLRLFSLRWQWVSPTHTHRSIPAFTLPLREQWRVLAASRSLLVFVVFGATWSFAAYCFGPFYQVFMFEPMRMSAFEVGLTATISQLGGALSLPAWGRLLDRYGNKPVMTVSLILWQLQYFAWCFVTPAHKPLLYFLWAWAGTTGAGFVLGQFTILLRLIPLEARNVALAFNLAVTSLVAAIAPIVGGRLLGSALARWPDSLAVYHACFALQPIVALGGAILLLRVREPAASPLTMVFGAMRNIRTLSGVLGLEFLVNYVFYRPAKRS
jgi:MFS family permease